MSKPLLQGLQSRYKSCYDFCDKSEKDVTDKRTAFLWGQEQAVLGTNNDTSDEKNKRRRK
jgi:hypothetical protein